MAEENKLPAIICLHGYGLNASIFRYQLRNLTSSLSTKFRFIFPDGPFLVDSPGPGATSIDSGPFRRWQSNGNIAIAFGISQEKVREELMIVRELLRSTLEREGPVVGVLAFSQGACLGTALCIDPELGHQIKFGVFICSLFPALDLGENNTGEKERQVEIPCIHVRASADPYGGQGLKLYEKHFVGDKARKIVEFVGRHEVPSRPDDVTRTVEAVLAVWDDLQDGPRDSMDASLPAMS